MTHPHFNPIGLALSLIGAALAGAPAAAQIGNPAGMTPAIPMAEPGTPAPGHPNIQDRLFVHLMATGGMAEVEAARLADSRIGDGPVREFARRMLRDHGASNDQLAQLARQDGIAWPDMLDPDHRAMQAQLQGLGGAAFEKAYLQGQIVDHQKAAQILEWEVGMGQDAQLQRHAAATLPAVLSHLQTLQQLQSMSSGAPPQGLAMASMQAHP
jgi:putative membrane protein